MGVVVCVRCSGIVASTWGSPDISYPFLGPFAFSLQLSRQFKFLSYVTARVLSRKLTRLGDTFLEESASTATVQNEPDTDSMAGWSCGGRATSQYQQRTPTMPSGDLSCALGLAAHTKAAIPPLVFSSRAKDDPCILAWPSA